MPDGGSGNCGNCRHFDRAERQSTLRARRIRVPLWTVCHDFNAQVSEPHGPLYAIICVVKGGAGGYASVPYFNGNRPDTRQPNGGGTIIYVDDKNGHRHEFESVEEYLAFQEKRK